MKIENFKKKIGLSKTTNSTLSAIKSNEKILLKNVPGSFMGPLSYTVIQQINGNHLFILSEKEEALYFFNDLENLYNKERGTTLLFYPASYRRPYQIVDPDPTSVLQRTEVIDALGKQRKKLISGTYNNYREKSTSK